MRIIFIGFLFITGILFSQNQSFKSINELNKIVDDWHLNASQTKFDAYFNKTTDDFVFLGTAPGERWNKIEFMEFCKPYFDKGKAWDFKSINRNWVFSKDQKIAWFDEELQTWMNSCRGSGVMVKIKGEWKIAYYNLSVLIENEKIKEFIKLREE